MQILVLAAALVFSVYKRRQGYPIALPLLLLVLAVGTLGTDLLRTASFWSARFHVYDIRMNVVGSIILKSIPVCLTLAVLFTAYRRPERFYLVKGDLSVKAEPVAFLPNTISARLLFSDAMVPVQLLFQPIPVPAIILSMIVFPITQGLAEIPLYMACAMPELVKRGRPRWLSLTLPAFFLGAQHIAVPLLFNGPFILWRLLMYMPFAFLIGIVMRYRPRLLPYLVILHMLMDISAGAMYFAFSI